MLNFSDTGSLTYEIKLENLYEGFFKHKHLFDASNYPKDSKFFDPTNKKVIDKMIKPKIYSMKNIDGKESNAAKGVNIATELYEFKDNMFNKKIIRHKMRRTQGKKHKMGTYDINKISLPAFDDKRFVLNDGIHTLPYFHIDLKN